MGGALSLQMRLRGRDGMRLKQATARWLDEAERLSTARHGRRLNHATNS